MSVTINNIHEAANSMIHEKDVLIETDKISYEEHKIVVEAIKQWRDELIEAIS